MASYEIEHGITSKALNTSASHPRRPDMSTFFATLSQLRTDGSDGTPHNNPHAVPTPVAVRATYGLLQESLESIRAGLGSDTAAAAEGADTTDAGDSTSQIREGIQARLLAQLISELQLSIDSPPSEITGVTQQFLDSLDRVPKSRFADRECPICGEPFKDDPYPLVVELPCHPQHWFDMDCVAPWLLAKGTCPLDRRDFAKKKEPVVPPKDEEEEEDYDDMIA